MGAGLTPDTVDEFLDGLNIVVEECDSLDIKAIVRERARAKGIPVLMATSDRGLVDVERFDLEPQRPILHGLLGDVDPAALSRMTSAQKVPYLLRLLEAEQVSGRLVASVLKIAHTLSTWPQVSGDVVLGAALIAEAVRKIGLGEHLPSGRARLDIGGVLDRLHAPASPEDHAPTPAEYSDPAWPGVAGIVAGAAIRAPSASNAQPWQIEVSPDAIAIRLAPEHTSTLDVGYRASAVALGAAVFNAKIAAAAHQVLGPVSIGEGAGGVPLQATLQLRDATDPQLAGLYDAMLARETNRRLGTAEPIPGDTVQLLHAAAERAGARLHLVTDPDEIIRAAKIFAESDRVRYLTPKLHAE